VFCPKARSPVRRHAPMAQRKKAEQLDKIREGIRFHCVAQFAGTLRRDLEPSSFP